MFGIKYESRKVLFGRILRRGRLIPILYTRYSQSNLEYRLFPKYKKYNYYT